MTRVLSKKIKEYITSFFRKGYTEEEAVTIGNYEPTKQDRKEIKEWIKFLDMGHR